MPGDPLGPEQIISSNSLALAAYVKVLGGDPLILGIARDSAESIDALLGGAPESDLLVTLGGASVGDYDLVQQALKDRGLDLGFYRVAMRPGKPLIFGRMGRVPVLGLPGNPVSAGVTTVVFLKPVMETMLGMGREDGPGETAVLGRDLGANDQRQDYLRAALATGAGGEAIATPFDAQDSSMMSRLARADCLVVRPPHAPAAKKGERVRIISLRQGLLSI
jgi:molybdopterin molybdotransferase